MCGVIYITLWGLLLLCDEPQHEISQFQQIGQAKQQATAADDDLGI